MSQLNFVIHLYKNIIMHFNIINMAFTISLIVYINLFFCKKKEIQEDEKLRLYNN